MPEIKQQLREYVEASIERIDADDVRAAARQPVDTAHRWRSLRPAWAFVMGVAVALSIGAIAFLVMNGDDETASPPASIAVDEGASSDAAATAREGDSILAVTKAGPTPPQAICPEGAAPDTLGDPEQTRPWGAAWSNQAAAFDRHRGMIVFIDETGSTWLFDVCTNTWAASAANVGLTDAQLVYDADSDVTIAIGESSVAVYDADADTWTRRARPSRDSIGPPGMGAVYDPLSGLVVVQTTSGLVAFDVAANSWSSISRVGDGESQPYLIGYLAPTDRLVLLDGFGGNAMLVDPGTGERADLPPPHDDVFAGFGRLNFAVGADSAYYADQGSVICPGSKLD